MFDGLSVDRDGGGQDEEQIRKIYGAQGTGGRGVCCFMVRGAASGCERRQQAGEADGGVASGGSEIRNDQQAVIVRSPDFVGAVPGDHGAAFGDDLAALDGVEEGEAGGVGDDAVSDGGLPGFGKWPWYGVCETGEGEEAGGGFAGYGEG